MQTKDSMDPSAAAGDKGVATGRGGDGLMSLEEHLPLDHLSLDQLPSVAPAAGINPVAVLVRHCSNVRALMLACLCVRAHAGSLDRTHAQRE